MVFRIWILTLFPDALPTTGRAFCAPVVTYGML